MEAGTASLASNTPWFSCTPLCSEVAVAHRLPPALPTHTGGLAHSSQYHVHFLCRVGICHIHWFASLHRPVVEALVAIHPDSNLILSAGIVCLSYRLLHLLEEALSY